MKNFAIFTVILTVLVIAAVAEIFVTDYLPNLKKDTVSVAENDFVSEEATPLPEGADISKIAKASVLGITGNESGDVSEKVTRSSSSFDYLKPSASKDPVQAPPISEFGSGVVLPTPVVTSVTTPTVLVTPTVDDSIPTSSVSDFEDLNFNLKRNVVYLRDDMIQSAGFLSSTATKDELNGFMFKTVYVDDLYDVTTVKYQIVSDLQLFAKVQVFNVGPLSSLSDVYEVLRARVVDSANSSINDSNTYGTASFYMNDTTRPDVAFLVVKFDSLIYAFSYPKQYHPQIVNLTKLIDMEF